MWTSATGPSSSPTSAPPRASIVLRTAPASTIASRAVSPTLATRTFCGGRRRIPTSRTRASSPRRCTGNFPARCSPITARRPSTGRRSSTRPPSPGSSASSARWATSSSSSPWPASTSSITACSSWRAATASAAWPPTRNSRQDEFAAETHGYTATRHQREVGTGYFDQVSLVITGGRSSTTAMGDSTETAQFQPAPQLVAAE